MLKNDFTLNIVPNPFSNCCPILADFYDGFNHETQFLLQGGMISIVSKYVNILSVMLKEWSAFMCAEK